MLEKLALMAIVLFSICNQSIQASDTPCISEEICRNLTKETCKHKAHGIKGKNALSITYCLGTLERLYDLDNEGKNGLSITFGPGSQEYQDDLDNEKKDRRQLKATLKSKALQPLSKRKEE